MKSQAEQWNPNPATFQLPGWIIKILTWILRCEILCPKKPTKNRPGTWNFIPLEGLGMYNSAFWYSLHNWVVWFPMINDIDDQGFDHCFGEHRNNEAKWWKLPRLQHCDCGFPASRQEKVWRSSQLQNISVWQEIAIRSRKDQLKKTTLQVSKSARFKNDWLKDSHIHNVAEKKAESESERKSAMIEIKKKHMIERASHLQVAKCAPAPLSVALLGGKCVCSQGCRSVAMTCFRLVSGWGFPYP